MTKVMHKFLICLSIYFCLTCFGVSFSPSSEAGVQFRQWFKSSGYGVILHQFIIFYLYFIFFGDHHGEGNEADPNLPGRRRLEE
jgi:hypothetical protein